MIACVIMHNMIIEDEGGTDDVNFDEISSHPIEAVSHWHSIMVFKMFERLGRIRSSESHSQLKEDLIKHIWDQYGD